ncbi:MAG: glycine zipper 2TM domain-containing protein [Roseomonas sp.]|nr:glycine zipper 2TM domain-containing protein [Roseomonas sp.]MCA3328598.1 glycine zipper 2TM domain-containing protein [Roseomonas sp.]MCA3331589.1 glycine zipper 2TM domain-containing protein [Roseomonas sp.]MCA3336368.1 glycine zipper 2TM domain-containing protein [Roseomonas sp.]MCA3346391.1 glycine zipper 2TM domain-containing protein [Roseomonas sp.]
MAACAPQTNSTVDRNALGIQGTVERGTIIAMRPVAVSGTRSGLGPAAGAVGGGFLGSTIGGDWRARTVGGVVGALAGGVAGAAIEESATRGEAMEFIIRRDVGGERVVTQTNELGLQVGERVMVTETDRARLSREVPGTAPSPR